MNNKLTIGWLYPELMSTYGDRGNIIALTKRCEWQGIEVEVLKLEVGFSPYDLEKCDLLFMGGAQDKQQQIVSYDLSKEKRKILKYMIDHNTPGLYICGAYQFLGKYYKEANGTIIPGLEILDLYTENPGENSERLIGNIIVDCHPEFISGSNFVRDSDLRQNDSESILVGFENHGGRTYLGKNVKPLGQVLKGFGNNGKDKTEGVVYKNSYGTYLHGPILPKNPYFADVLIKKALEKKYKKTIDLVQLDDSLEQKAHDQIIKKY